MRTLAVIAASLALTASPALAEGPVGLWMSEVNEEGRFIHVEIAPCDSVPAELCGTIVGAFGGATQENVGKPIVWGMSPDGQNAWAGGRIWAPDEDETYRSKMELTDAGLKVSGCILGGLICRGQTWIRVP